MQKIGLISFIAALTVASSALAIESSDFYVKGGVGYEILPSKIRLESQKYKAGTAAPSVVDGDVKQGSSYNSGNLDGAILSAGLGYKIAEEFRTDLMFDYRLKQKQKYSFPVAAFYQPATGVDSLVLHNHEITRESWAVVMNVYYDFTNTSEFTPFINAGLGYGSVKIKGLFTAQDANTKAKSSFVWNIGGGIAYKIADEIYTDLAYKLTSMESSSANKDQKLIDENQPMAEVKMKGSKMSHSANLGLRVEF